VAARLWEFESPLAHQGFFTYTYILSGRLAQLARAPRLHRGGHRFESYIAHHIGGLAQLVERRPEEPCVAGSIPAAATKKIDWLQPSGFLR
jgi:hypothetical protein